MSDARARTWMIKREAWINHAIPCPERKRLLQEIRQWLDLCTTTSLIEVLPVVAQYAEEGVLTDPMVEMPLEAGEDPLETKPGLILVDEDLEQHDAGSNGKRADAEPT